MAEQKSNAAPLLIAAGLLVLGGVYLFTRKPATPPPPPPETFRLVITTGPSGNTSPAPGVYEYDAGAHVAVTAMPIQGYKFDRWTGDVTEAEAIRNPVGFDMLSDRSIKANFVVNPTPTMYSVTFTAQAGGTITPAGTYTYEANSFVTVQAVPNAGYKFMGWSGNWTGTTNPDQVQIWMDGMVVTALFSPIQQNGVQLQAGYNNAIKYGGNPGTVQAVFAPVIPYMQAGLPIWVYRNGQWYWWEASDPGSNLTYVYQNDLCYIYVTQAVFWTWL